METSWHSYGSIYNLGHRATAELFDGPVLVEEKVDGSQFSFGIFGGELKCRSKGQQLVVDAPEKMFAAAVASVQGRAHFLRDGWTYRAEYLQSKKHNTLCYERHPTGHLIIFDIATGEECYLDHYEKWAEAERIGLECVPVMHYGKVASADEVRVFLDRESILGGCKVEGVVIKNYAKFSPDKKTLMGKYVSEAFKEAHGTEWKKSNPRSGDIVQDLTVMFRTDARWQKAIQHLREDGRLEGSPRDIGNLIKEVQSDVQKECAEEIASRLVAFAMPQIMRGVTTGLPEWYKQQLLESAFAPVEELAAP